MCTMGSLLTKENKEEIPQPVEREPSQYRLSVLLTSVNIFLVPFQGLLAFQPLSTAVGFAHKPGIPSASLLVLLKTIRQVARGAEEVITIYLQTLNITAGFCNPCLLGHASCRSLRIILCINYVGKKEELKFFRFLSIMLTNSK